MFGTEEQKQKNIKVFRSVLQKVVTQRNRYRTNNLFMLRCKIITAKKMKSIRET
jgi:hypothetical protein